MTVKPLGGKRYQLDFSGQGQYAVLWSTRPIQISQKGEHIRVSGSYRILKSEYGSMSRMRINSTPRHPVLTMSGDRYQAPWTQTKSTGQPDRFDFSTRGNPGTQYAFNIEFYGNPQTWILEDFSIRSEIIRREGRPPVSPENRSYQLEQVLNSLKNTPKTTFQLQKTAGRVRLLLNGKPTSPAIYRRGPHYPFWTRYGYFRDAGIDLCYFFAMFSPPSPSHDRGVAGMWLGKDKYDFSKLDEELRVIHSINPKARVILALCLGIYPGWEKEHPDSVFTNARGEKAYAITTGKRLYYGKEAEQYRKLRSNEEFSACPSYYSDAFRASSVQAVSALVKHLENTPEGRIVCGIHVNGGADGQFFPPDRDVTRGEDHSPAAKKAWSRYLRMIYKNDLSALRKAWKRNDVTFEEPGIPDNRERGNDNSGSPVSMRGRDYILFTSYSMSTLRLAIFRAIKASSSGRLMAGSYYPPGTAGNFHPDMMLRSEDTDFLIDIQRITPAGSFQLHNKLYIGEVDMRVPDCMTPIGNYVFDRPTFENVVRQTVSNIIQREGGMYHLFDIGEAYYHKKSTVDFFGKVRKEHDAALSDHSIAPAVGVFLDYQQLAGCTYRAADQLRRLILYSTRHVLEHSGVPFQVYSAADLFDPQLKLPPILFFPLLPDLTPQEIEKLRQRAKRSGSVIVWGAWRPREQTNRGTFAGFALSIPEKNALSPLISVHPEAGPQGSVPGESYTVGGFNGNFIAFNEKPCRIAVQKDDVILAVYAGDHAPGMIKRSRNGLTEYINGAPGAYHPDFFRALARRQGAEVLSDSSRVIVLAENGILTCVCERGGKITVKIPKHFRIAGSTSGIPYQVNGDQLQFTANNDFEVQSFKLIYKTGEK